MRTTDLRVNTQRVASLIVVLLIASIVSANDHKSTEGLRQVESKVIRLIEKVLPCTVGIGSQEMPVGGSGVVVSREGLILTAGHVTQAAGKELIIFFPDGKRVKAVALGANYSRDSGMAKITEAGEYPFVELGDSVDLKEDQWCVALGHAGGYQISRTPPVRLGRVLHNDPEGFIDSDCTLIGGDSGGPLFNLDGRLIGIHSNIGATLTMNRHVPVQTFRHDWQRLEEGDTWGRLEGMPFGPGPDTAILGVRPRPGDEGVVIEVIPGGPASKAGVQDGDTIKAIDGNQLKSFSALAAHVMQRKPGETVRLSLQRGEDDINIAVQLRRFGDVRLPEKPPGRLEPPTPDEAPAQPRNRDDDKSDRVDEATERKEQPKPEADQSEDATGRESDERKPQVELTEEEIEDQLQTLLKEAIKNGGRLELTPEQIDRFGGPRRIARRLGRLFRSGGLADIELPPRPEEQDEDKFFAEVMATFKTIVTPASQSVFPIVRGERTVALATAVREGGYFLTKASELRGRRSLLLSGDNQLPVNVLAKFPKHDLALIKADVKTVPVDWYLPKEDPPLGSFVAAAGPDGQPLGVGVISVLERNLSGADRPFLGVGLDRRKDGFEIVSIQKGSAAENIGLKPGDVIRTLDGKRYKTVPDFVDALSRHKPGDEVRLEIKRGNKDLSKLAKLGSRERFPQESPGMRRYPTGGRLSNNRGGYANALQTDLPINPEHCGSPLVDLDGRALGLNIARAGRTKSYAVPGDVIQRLLDTVDFTEEN